MGIPSDVPVGLIFEKGKGLLAWLVRLFTHSKYAHVSIVFKSGETAWVCEANADIGRVVQWKLSEFRPGKYLYVPTRVGMSKPVTDFLFTAVYNQPYDWWDFLRAGAGLQPKNQGYQCAELVQKLFSVAGGNLPDAPTPQAILNQLRKFSGHQEFELEHP